MLVDQALGPPFPPSISPFNLSILSEFWTASCSSSSSLSLVWSVPRRSESRVRQFQQLAQRLHLPRHLLGFEVLQALEVQIDLDLARIRIFGDLVLHRIRQVGFHAFQDAIEVVRIHFDEFPVFQPGKRFFGLSGKVGQDAHHERQFFDFNGVANLDIVGYVHARRSDSSEFLVDAFSCHFNPFWWSKGPSNEPMRALLYQTSNLLASAIVPQTAPFFNCGPGGAPLRPGETRQPTPPSSAAPFTRPGPALDPEQPARPRGALYAPLHSCYFELL